MCQLPFALRIRIISSVFTSAEFLLYLGIWVFAGRFQVTSEPARKLTCLVYADVRVGVLLSLMLIVAVGRW